jgi:ribonucleotide reductase beta subunit family protein with ferritin-like domain
VLRVYEQVFGIKGGIESVKELADRNLDPVSKTLLYDTLEAWTLPLLERQDEDTFLQAVFAYHLIGEGVVARTGQNLAAAQYERYQGFPGLTQGQRLVSRDEARHIGIGVSYIRQRMELEPDRTRAIIDDMANQLFQPATDTLATANNHMADLVTSGYGVDPQAFRLSSIGYLA